MFTDFLRKSKYIFLYSCPGYKIQWYYRSYIFFPQVYEVLKLLNELLPTSAGDQDDPQLSDKESFLVNQPDLLQKFGMDILPLLIQVLFLLYRTSFALHPNSIVMFLSPLNRL